MITFSNTIEIARPPAEVFAYLADLEHTPEWNWAIASTRKVTPGPVGVGTRYRQSRSVPRSAVEMLEVTAFQPDERIQVAGGLGPFQARLAYELSPSDGGTRVTNSVELEAPGALGLIGGLFTGRIQASVAENLGVLRRLLEGGRPSSSA